MKVHHIINALTNAFRKQYPDKKGIFIGVESFKPTSINAYKEYTIDIYYKLDRITKKVFTYSAKDRFIDANKDTLKEEHLRYFLESLFLNLQTIYNETI